MSDTAERPQDPPPNTLTRWVFLRALGGVYLVVFASLQVQIEGLIGERGLEPVSRVLEWASQVYGPWEKLWRLPSLFWIDASDAALQGVCLGGMVLSLLLIFGVAPVPVLVLLWVFALSVSVVGGSFLLFQWDALLLEVGFLAIFLAPLTLLPGLKRETPVPQPVLWLLRAVLFRLMFSSGWVKLASGDETWRGLTALEHHYETQPLPTWIGWYAHQLPPSVQSFSVVVMFVVELLVPFLIFAPGRWRLGGFVALAGLQLVLMATGNFAFFTVLTLALCLLLLDDRTLERFVPPHFKPLTFSERRAWSTWVKRGVFVPLTVVLGTFAAIQTTGTVVGFSNMPKIVQESLGEVRQWCLVNRYGVFAVMTTQRPEIIIEGSRDGRTWEPYAFAWKPGDVREPPAFVAPHQPRLDWQMWFAALRGYKRTPWFGTLMRRLLEGEPKVLGLLDHNPFEQEPPRYVRAVVYDYQLSDFDARSKTGAWWTRKPLGLYAPVLSLPRSTPQEAPHDRPASP